MNTHIKRVLDRASKNVDKFINFSFNAPCDNIHQQNEVYDYACNLLSTGCFYLAFRDATKEGDGKHVSDCWQYLLPIFHNSGCK